MTYTDEELIKIADSLKEEWLDKACEWLKENTYFYVNDYTGSLNEEKLTEEFRKVMENKL